LPLRDLAQALPGLVVAVLLPGYALATLLVPRWRAWERLAGAPGLSAGFFGVLGLGMRLVHVPFEPRTVLPCIALLGVAGFVRRRRAGSNPSSGLPWWIPVPALLAGGVAAGVFAAALSSQVLPPDWDPSVHGALATAIAQTHDVIPLFPKPLQGTAVDIARPGFEAMAAVVSWVGGPSPVASMEPIMVLTLVLLPLGLTMLALEATGSIGLALIVPLVAAGMEFPSFQAIVGRFPQVVDSTLIVPFIVAAMRVLRARQTLDNALLVVAATASIWVVHGLEVLTALVIGGVLLASTVEETLREVGRIALRRTGVVGMATAAGALLVTVLTRLPHVPPPTAIEASNVSAPPPPPIPGAPNMHEILQFVAQTDFASPIAIALYCIGVVVLVLQRRMLWVLAAHLVVLLAIADSLYSRHLGGFWKLVFSWGDADRLLGVLFWILPFIFAAGLLAIAAVMRSLARDRRLAARVTLGAGLAALIVFLLRGPLDASYTALFGAPPIGLYPIGVYDSIAHLAPWRLTVAAASAAIALAWIVLVVRGDSLAGFRARLRLPPGFDVAAGAVAVIALISLAVGARADFTTYQRSIALRATATPADVAVLDSMSARLPRGALVLTDGVTDAGIWVSSLTDLIPLVPAGYEDGALSVPLVGALAEACVNPTAAEAALQKVAAVFVGSHHLAGRADAWDPQCIARLPDVRQIAAAPWQGTEAAAFAVIH
jgi:hypothetical protein